MTEALVARPTIGTLLTCKHKKKDDIDSQVKACRVSFCQEKEFLPADEQIGEVN